MNPFIYLFICGVESFFVLHLKFFLETKEKEEEEEEEEEEKEKKKKKERDQT